MGNIERQYGVDLTTRFDTKLGNLLRQRGFDSLTQLLAAYSGNATSPARPRREPETADGKTSGKAVKANSLNV